MDAIDERFAIYTVIILICGAVGALAGGFATGPNASTIVTGKRVLVVDDVFTTGSTVKAAADALKSAGASWVGAAALTVQPIGSLK